MLPTVRDLLGLPEKEVPRGQFKGAIKAGPSGFVVCDECQMGMKAKHLRGHMRSSHAEDR